jgi:putative transferase (TIGR04331 family)
MNLITFNDDEIAISNKDKKKLLRSKKNFYIGEWCLNKKNFFNKKLFLDIYKYSNTSKENLEFLYLNKIYRKVLDNLVKSLNKYHNKKYPKKYWEILIYRWLWNYILHLYARWEIAKKVIKIYKIKTVYDLNFDNKSFIPDSTIHARNIMTTAGNNYWNHQIFINIFKYKYKKKIKIKKIILNRNFNIMNIITSLSPELKYHSILNYSFNKRHFFYDISLNNKFFFCIKYFFKFFFKIAIKTKYLNFQKKDNREKFYLFKKSNCKFEDFLNFSLEWNFPRIFLENYSKLECIYSKLNWPKKPRYIYSELAHNFDEVYKIYLAKNKLSGSKIVFFQHGYGGYFKNNNYYNIFYEKEICDKYFAWGSNLKEKKVYNIRIHYLDEDKKYIYNFNSNKGILIELYDFNEVPQRTPNRYLSSYNRKINTINMVSNLFINLNSNIKKNINFKILNQSNKKLIESSIKSKFLEVKFLNTNKRSYRLLNKFNLQIHFFLGTGFFESMYLNFPVILIYDEKFLDKLDLNFKKMIQSLIDVNIIFKDSIAASQFINNNYFNIKEWWLNSKLQNIRNQFAKKYCDSGLDFFKKIKTY